MPAFFFEHALLPDGWSRDVRIGVVDGRIAAIARNVPVGDARVVPGFALPGLPNLHSHAFQRAMAGLAERRGPAADSFWTWRSIMYRFLEHLVPEDVEAIAAFAYMAMLEAGYTSVAEFHYLHHGPDGQPYADPAEMAQRVVAAAKATGVGLTLLPVLYSASGFGGTAPLAQQRRFALAPDAYISLAQQCRALTSAHGLGFGVAPHSLRAATPEGLARVLAAFPDVPVHIHVAEQEAEVEQCRAWSGQRPVSWLYDNFSPDHRWCLVHATHVDRGEIELMAGSGAVVGLCPSTEANLGDGLFPAETYLALGGRFGVGSDSHIEIDAPGELRLLEYGQRLHSNGRNRLAQGEGQSTGETLYLGAVAGGAAALQRPSAALAQGHLADIVVLDRNHPDLGTCRDSDRIDNYIFVAGTRAVRTVLVAGKVVVDAGRHLRRDEIMATYTRRMSRLRSA